MSAVSEIKRLREQGYLIQVSHYRRYAGHFCVYQRHEQPGETPLGKGGYTRVRILHPSLDIHAEANALCHPRDNFSRRIGLEIAFGRAMKVFGHEQSIFYGLTV